MSDTPVPPASHAHLLEGPLFAHLATVRPQGSPQVNVMWFAWDGSRLRFTHTKDRQKYVNLTKEPRVALSISDPADPYRFLEVRGAVESIEDDDERASFYVSFQERYGKPRPIPPDHRRVVVTVRPTRFVAFDNGRLVEGK